LKYALGTANYKKVKIYENLKEAINNALENLSANKMLYILPNYSAMLEVRKILTGKKIL
jgi:lipid II isoglutaminyl synthase (glutamine-hydrolysing)